MNAVPGSPRHSDIADAGLADVGVDHVEWADRSMPVLRAIRERFAATRPFEGLRIGACMHVTAETANVVRAFVAGGADVHLAASNPLSTQDDVAAALVEAYGVTVHARRGVDLATYVGHLEAVLDAGPRLVLDDGCDLVSVLHARRADLIDGVLAGAEQTTTGVLRLRAMAQAGVLRIPVVAVNDTATKRMFDNRFGTGQSTMDAIMRVTNTLLAGTVVVIVGYGYCGRGLAARARGLGADVVVTEVDPVKALDAALEGYRVLPMADAAEVGAVFVTATGNRDVIRAEHLERMPDSALLVNAGHFDVEIDVRWLRSAAVRPPRRVRPGVDEYVLPNGRRMLLLAEGRVANLALADGHPPPVMDLSFADHALTVEWLVGGARDLAPGVHDVPAEIDNSVAELKLAALGVRIDQLTPEQVSYQSSWIGQ